METKNENRTVKETILTLNEEEKRALEKAAIVLSNIADKMVDNMEMEDKTLFLKYSTGCSYSRNLVTDTYRRLENFARYENMLLIRNKDYEYFKKMMWLEDCTDTMYLEEGED